MPTCTGCGTWIPANRSAGACPACGSVLETTPELRQAQAAAAADGLTMDEYRTRQWDERHAEMAAAAERSREEARAREEAARAQPQRWDHDPPADMGQGEGLLFIMFVGPGTVVFGVILLVAFLILGEPFWIPIVATAVGVIGGFLLFASIMASSREVFDWLAYRSGWVDRHGETVWGVFDMAALVLTAPLLTLGLAVLLARLL